MKKTTRKLRRMIAILLVLAAVLSTTSLAAFSDGSEASPMASAYVKSCNANINKLSNGDISISFSINATGTMTEIGVTDIYLYQYDGSTHSTAATFHHTDPGYEYLMSGNRKIYSGSVTYDATAGNEYHAYVFFKAKNANGSDSPVVHTLTVTA